MASGTIRTNGTDIIFRTVTATISRSYNAHVGVTAPDVSGYRFLCWSHVVTNGWIGMVYTADITQQVDAWVWTASTGQSGNGQIVAWAMYVKE